MSHFVRNYGDKYYRRGCYSFHNEIHKQEKETKKMFILRFNNSHLIELIVLI